MLTKLEEWKTKRTLIKIWKDDGWISGRIVSYDLIGIVFKISDSKPSGYKNNLGDSGVCIPYSAIKSITTKF